MRDQFISDLADALEVETDLLVETTELDSLNWDSLAIISTIAIADSTYGVMLTGEDLFNAKTFGDIIKLLPDD